MGVKHFCMGWDVGILHGWWRTNGEQIRKDLGGGGPR
jgi:4-hydroxy-2-oxoheptanedioate aldolase